MMDFKPRQPVAYIPPHQRPCAGRVTIEMQLFDMGTNIEETNLELGLVSSSNDHYVFVKFHPQLGRFGWNGTTSQSCRPEDLFKRPHVWADEMFVKEDAISNSNAQGAKNVSR